MEQNMTEARKQFVRLNPTVGYEEDLGLVEEIELAFDFCLVCEAPLVRHVADKQADDLPVSDPSWLDAFNAAADESFEESFDALLSEDERPAATPSLPPIPARSELDALRAELRLHKRGAA